MSNLMLMNNGKLVKRNGGNLGTFPAWTSFIDDLLNEEFLGEKSGHFNKGISIPKVNIHETNEAYNLEMAVPGYQKTDFVLDVVNDQLSISAEIKSEATESEAVFTRREFGYDSFKRTFNLPETVESDGIKARYNNGILFVEIPKKEEAKPKAPRTIKIS